MSRKHIICSGKEKLPLFSVLRTFFICSSLQQSFILKKTPQEKLLSTMDILHPEFVLFFTCAGKNNLRYLLIGGYAENFYGYNRNTNDMDVWIAPTNENKLVFINTLLCMKYFENEVASLYNEDFTKPFKADISTPSADIDILTVVHPKISFEDAEKNKAVFTIDNISMNFVPYDFLK